MLALPAHENVANKNASLSFFRVLWEGAEHSRRSASDRKNAGLLCLAWHGTPGMERLAPGAPSCSGSESTVSIVALVAILPLLDQFYTFPTNFRPTEIRATPCRTVKMHTTSTTYYPGLCGCEVVPRIG